MVKVLIAIGCWDGHSTDVNAGCGKPHVLACEGAGAQSLRSTRSLVPLNWNVPPVTAKTGREPWVFIYSGTAVVMLCAVAVFLWSVFQSRREGGGVTARRATVTDADLARFFPPAYNGSPPAAHDFASAIELYSHRDYAAAVPALRAAADAHPELIAARFYLGVCELYSGARDAGVTDLKKTVAAGGGPYREQARFYLAKGLIGSGDIPAAKDQLEQVIALHGDLEQQAEMILAKLKLAQT